MTMKYSTHKFWDDLVPMTPQPGGQLGEGQAVPEGHDPVMPVVHFPAGNWANNSIHAKEPEMTKTELDKMAFLKSVTMVIITAKAKDSTVPGLVEGVENNLEALGNLYAKLQKEAERDPSLKAAFE